MIFLLPLVAGIAIGYRYKVLVLVSAVIVTALLSSPAGWLLMLESSAAIQVGYVVGLAIRASHLSSMECNQ
jgi:hypothetical protein